MKKIKQIIKWVERFLFGWKLPCGHVRSRAKLGERVICHVCGGYYFLARLVCKNPRRAGVMLYQEDIEI